MMITVIIVFMTIVMNPPYGNKQRRSIHVHRASHGAHHGRLKWNRFDRRQAVTLPIVSGCQAVGGVRHSTPSCAAELCECPRCCPLLDPLNMGHVNEYQDWSRSASDALCHSWNSVCIDSHLINPGGRRTQSFK